MQRAVRVGSGIEHFSGHRSQRQAQPEFGPCVQSHRLSAGLYCRKTRSRVQPSGAEERGDSKHHGMFRAGSGLRGGQDSALGLEEVPECIADHWFGNEVCWGGDVDRQKL